MQMNSLRIKFLAHLFRDESKARTDDEERNNEEQKFSIFELIWNDF